MSSSSMKTTVKGYVGYRGKEGQWSFLLHRITGLGVLLFLAIHIVDTSFVYFAPDLYGEVINLYRSTLFGLGEVALVFCLFFHGVNGIASLTWISSSRRAGRSKASENRQSYPWW